MKINLSNLLIGFLFGILVGIFVGKQFFADTTKNNHTASNQSYSNNLPSTNYENSTQNTTDGEIPQKALEVLNYVRQHHQAIDGYVGGRTFGNRERLLPKQDENGEKMRYQEWDVNPKINGQNRGAERLVTSHDGRAWYTSDHYRTFTEIK